MLSKRLQSLTNYFNKDDKVIDIGCDHALIDIYMIKNNIVNSIIVSDIHEGALNQGIKNIRLNHLKDVIDCRLGDGLKVLTDEDDINTILISGMGASTIIDILNNPYIDRINKLVIQSNNDHEDLRKYITSIGFIINDESFIFDNDKYYINILFERGNEKYSQEDMKYGPILKNNKEYLEYMINHNKEILSYIPIDKKELIETINNEIKVLSELLSR